MILFSQSREKFVKFHPASERAGMACNILRNVPSILAPLCLISSLLGQDATIHYIVSICVDFE